MGSIAWWTLDRVEAVRALAAAGKRCPEIARIASRRFRRPITALAIAGLCRRFGIRTPRGRRKKEE